MGATLTAVLTPTPVVVVVTAVGGAPQIPATATPDPGSQATLAAATQTLAAASATAPAAETAAPGPSPTAAAPGTAQATPAPAGTPPVTVGDLLFDDDFSQPGLWGSWDDPQYRVALADGQLAITIKVPDRYTLVYTVERQAADFYAHLTGLSGPCRFRDRLGLLFRVQDGGSYYQFEVDCDGRYRLARVDGGILTAIIDWTASPALHPGGEVINELGVLASGPRLEVFANGQKLAGVDDAAYTAGGFGLYAGSGLSENFSAAFDRLQVWENR